MVVGITTKGREGAVELVESGWLEGGAPKRSWASPWYLLTIKPPNVRDRMGRLSEEITDRIAGEVGGLVGLDASLD